MKPVTECLSIFLDRHKIAGNADLVARYNRSMECQLLVRKGEPVNGKGCLYSDGVRTWWDIRVPKDAASEPRWEDYTLTWPLEEYAADFGMSGWDWEQRCSKWVGFDLDSIAGGHEKGLTPEQIEEARAALAALPYVELRRSTARRRLPRLCPCGQHPD